MLSDYSPWAWRSVRERYRPVQVNRLQEFRLCWIITAALAISPEATSLERVGVDSFWRPMQCIVPPFARPIPSLCPFSRPSACLSMTIKVGALRKWWEIGLLLLWGAYRLSPPGYSADPSPTPTITSSHTWGSQPLLKIAWQIAAKRCQIGLQRTRWFLLTAHKKMPSSYPAVPSSTPLGGTPLRKKR